ncbi:unnamed protein product, partial [Allacma fusca]
MPRRNRKSVGTMSSFQDESRVNESLKDQSQLDSLCENLYGKMAELMSVKFADMERKLNSRLDGENQERVSMVTGHTTAGADPNEMCSHGDVNNGNDRFVNSPDRFASSNRPELINLGTEDGEGQARMPELHSQRIPRHTGMFDWNRGYSGTGGHQFMEPIHPGPTLRFSPHTNENPNNDSSHSYLQGVA